MAHFEFGGNNLNLLSEVAVLVKNWDEHEDVVSKAMRLGFGFDDEYVVGEKAVVKNVKKKRASPPWRTIRVSNAINGLPTPTNWVLEESAVLVEFFNFCAAKTRSEKEYLTSSQLGAVFMPKKKRSIIRRRRTNYPTCFPCLLSQVDSLSVDLIHIPRKKRSSLRRITPRFFLPHAAAASNPCDLFQTTMTSTNVKRKRHSASSSGILHEYDIQNINDEGFEQKKKQKMVL